jgi:hypothetical protein
MSFQLFEVWTEDEDGHQVFLETSASKKAAKIIAEKAVLEGAYAAVIFQETEDGDTEEVERFERD